MSWNPTLDLVLEIKHDYHNTFDTYDNYKFESWLEKLNKQKYNEVFECLQVNQFNEFILIRYGLHEMADGMWTNPNSIYRECRSIVIDLEKEKLVLTPFRKFFNINEVDENKIKMLENKIKKAKILEITNKLDGSMQSARWYNDKVFLAGSMAMDVNNSWRLKDGYSMLTENYIQMIKENLDYTFIFEYISIQDGHVVLYNKQDEGLYLIGIRNVVTGEQLSYSQIKEYAKRYNAKMTQIEDLTFEEVLTKMKEFKSNQKEGWVLNIDGQFVKIKCDDYVHLHRLLDKVSSINVIIENIAEDRYDDLLSKIPENYKDRIKKVAKIIFDYKNTIIEKINNYFELAPKDDKKDFMIWVDNNVPNDIKGYVRCIYLNRDFNVLKKGLQGYKKMNDMGFDTNYSALFADLEEI